MADNSKGTILITGANGFIGKNLSAHLMRQGYNVRGLVRNPERAETPIPLTLRYRGNLPDDIDLRAFEKVDAVIHCAYRTFHHTFDEAKRDNEEGTALVVQLSRSANVKRFIFLSSLSAHDRAVSYYGKSKFALERLCNPTTDLIIRPGLVLGKTNAGLFERMIAPLKRYPLVPLLDGGKQTIQTVYIDDLCCAIHIALEKNLTGTLSIADPHGILLKNFLKEVSQRLHRNPVLLPIPSLPVLSIVRLLGKMNIYLPISSENILSLRNLQFVDTSDDLSRLGMTLLSPVESLERIFSN